MQAVRTVLDASGADLNYRTVDHRTLPMAEIAAAIRQDGAALKGPLATPQDGTSPSLNVALRRELGLHTQVRRVRSAPATPGPPLDVRIVRETTEGLFAGIGFDAGTPEVGELSRLTGGAIPADAAVSFKYVTEGAARRTCGVGCDVAAAAGCDTIVAAHKAAAIPHADGHFLRIAAAVVAERREQGLTARLRPLAVDAVAARLVTHPTELTVVVTTNLYGDILSDVAGAVAGSVALTAGVNVGSDVATFEAAHGAVWRHAGHDTANPVGLLLSAVLLLEHLGARDAAQRVERAVSATLSSGIATADLRPARVVGTQGFAAEVVRRID
jgi:isocitrate dehydrogenase (NAD+)